MHPLHNPIWRALTTRQSHLGHHAPPASKFDRDVSVLGGFETPDYAAMASLLEVGQAVGLFVEDPVTPPGFEHLGGAPLLQMPYDGRQVTEDDAAGITVLGAADAPDMRALTELTKPGPFGPRTHEMGDFLGIRVDGALVAMAGQRLRLPGHTEVSAICTHPDHLGRGLAAALTRAQVRRILAIGEQPFLHVRADNERAIGLYERLGFVRGHASHYVVLRRTA